MVKLLVYVQMLSAQFLLTPLFESAQTCKVEGPREEMFPIDFQIKGQSQTAESLSEVMSSHKLMILCLMVTNLCYTG